MCVCVCQVSYPDFQATMYRTGPYSTMPTKYTYIRIFFIWRAMNTRQTTNKDNRETQRSTRRCRHSSPVLYSRVIQIGLIVSSFCACRKRRERPTNRQQHGGAKTGKHHKCVHRQNTHTDRKRLRVVSYLTCSMFCPVAHWAVRNVSNYVECPSGEVEED